MEARLRLAIGRKASLAPATPDEIRSGDLAIDEATYTARLRARALDLTFKEFELLKFLAQHPGRVFTRAHLLQEVWGYDYFGGTRTVDVHVRRLRAKLGTEHEALIGTVRNVGYRFVPAKGADEGRAPRVSRPADQEPANGGVTEADGLPADGLPAGAGSAGGGAAPVPPRASRKPGRENRPAEARPAETSRRRPEGDQCRARRPGLRHRSSRRPGRWRRRKPRGCCSWPRRPPGTTRSARCRSPCCCSCATAATRGPATCC